MYMTKGAGTSASAPVAGAAFRPLAREYGRAGLFGLLAPQGNPVAEPEIRILLPPSVALVSARLTSSRTLLHERLLEYRERLAETVNAFGEMALDAVAVACTGSSYGIEASAEQELARAVAAQKGYPLITAAQAVEAALQELRIDAIALVSPYPAWLTEACRAHWEGRGMKVTSILQLQSASTDPQRHGIYELSSTAILDAMAGLDLGGAGAILLTGTGMPSLRVILARQRVGGPPVLSSNLCLAWALARITGAAAAGRESPLLGGWATRLAAA